jgi:two-component system, cell cycle response regulator DivK
VGQKILVVEDNELNLKLFCDLLRAHGYAAEPVRDGREAVDRARAFAPDLVVMDIQMPHVSGLELIEQMKADDGLRRTPIMAVTAYAAKGDEERIRDAGAEGYVSKPISVVRFVEAVAGLLKTAAERPAMEAGDQAAADAVAAAQGSSAIEAEVKAEAPAAEARAVEASQRAEAIAAAVEAAEASTVGEAERAEEPTDEDAQTRHAGEGRHPDDGAVEEESVDPGVRRDDAGPNGATP